MSRKKNDKSTYDYNIYRLPFDKRNQFIDYLEQRQFEEIPLSDDKIKNANGFSFTLMFCNKDKVDGSSWTRLLSLCSERDLIQELRVCGAALICSSNEDCYVVSYGNAHFYINNFCDYNFGINIAERLINIDSIRSQQNISHGSKISKTHMDYIIGATLSYRSGEIPTYIRGNSISREDWGDVINCGTSAQFKWEELPTEIGEKLCLLSEALNKKTNITLPKLIELNELEDSGKIKTLYENLATAINEYDESIQRDNFINVPSFYLVGTKLLQNDSVKFRLSCKHKREEYDGELSVSAIKRYIADKEIDYLSDLTKINIAVEYANDQWTPYRPMIDYIEYITNDNFCLRNGKWCSFNEAYIDRMLRDLSWLPFENCTKEPFAFCKSALVEYAKNKGIYVQQKKQPYETYYNVNLAEKLNAVCIHPSTVPVERNADGRFKLELCDLYLDDVLYFVKIGAPTAFAYAIDQAMLTLDKIERENGKLQLSDTLIVYPLKFCLLLAFDTRKSIVATWKDILSINFLVHLSELKQRLNATHITLDVKFAYDLL